MRKIKDFLYIEREGDIYTVLMTPELQDDLGTIGFVEFLPGEHFEAGEGFVSIEATKTVYEAQCPIAGRVVKRHKAVEGQPDLLNSDQATDNWLIQLTDVDEAVFESLEEAQ